MLDKSNKEKLAVIAERANRYNLTPLLEQVCYYADPTENRRNLMACYFTIAAQTGYIGEGAGHETGAALLTLRRLIEAMDAMAEVAPKGLRVAPEDEPGTRQTLEQYAAEIEATKRKLQRTAAQAGKYADLYNHLWQMAAPGLTPEQQRKHKELKSRLIGKHQQHP